MTSFPSNFTNPFPPAGASPFPGGDGLGWDEVELRERQIVEGPAPTPVVVNGTQHVINIYAESDTTPIQGGRKLVLNPGAVPVHIIPGGTNLNATTGNLPAPSLNTPFALKGGVVFTGHDPIPDGDIVVVSNLYRSAVKELGGDTSRLATVFGTVYEDESAVRPCGCLALAVG